MKSLHVALPLAVLVLLGVVGCSYIDTTPQPTGEHVLKGTVNFRAPDPLPAGAVATVRLLDVTRTDAPPEVLAEQTVTNVTTAPVAFELTYKAEDIQPPKRARLDARIAVGGKLRFYSANAYPVSPGNADGSLIADNEYRTAKMKLEKEKVNLEQNLANADEKETELADLTEKTFKFACYARAWFNEGSEKEKRAILLSLGSNFLLKGKLLSIDLHFPWKEIAEQKEKSEKEVQAVRTPARIANTMQLFALSRKFLTLRRVEDSNL